VKNAILGVRFSDLDARLLKWWCDQNGQNVSDLIRLAVEGDINDARCSLMGLDASYLRGNSYAAELRDLVLESEQ
jgi:hypothetical protein